MRAVIAAITARAAETVAAAAPAGVDVTVLPAAHEEAEFLVISDDAEVLDALPGLRAARVVQTLSAGRTGSRTASRRGSRSATPAGRATRRSPSG